MSALYLLFAFLTNLICDVRADQSNCVFVDEWLEELNVSRVIHKSGFHRDLVFSVFPGPLTPLHIQALLVQKLPSGVYVDQYQLRSQLGDAGLQVLLDSMVDLEAPAYLSPSFTAFIFPTLVTKPQQHLSASVPLHGRYHRPSRSGSQTVRIAIEAPRLLLRSGSCEMLQALPPHSLVMAPCTAYNLSMCVWLEIQHWQDQSPVSVELPVGDASLLVHVCVGTLLVTLVCYGALTRVVWEYGFNAS